MALCKKPATKGGHYIISLELLDKTSVQEVILIDSSLTVIKKKTAAWNWMECTGE